MKQTRCPVQGCRKRGDRRSLIDHARVKHPHLFPIGYQALLDHNGASAPPRRSRAVQVITGVLIVLAILGLILWLARPATGI